MSQVYRVYTCRHHVYPYFCMESSYQCRNVSSSHTNSSVVQDCNNNTGYRVHGVCALESSGYNYTFSADISCPILSNSSGAMNPGVPTGEVPTLRVNPVDTWLMP